MDFYTHPFHTNFNDLEHLAYKHAKIMAFKKVRFTKLSDREQIYKNYSLVLFFKVFVSAQLNRNQKCEIFLQQNICRFGRTCILTSQGNFRYPSMLSINLCGTSVPLWPKCNSWCASVKLFDMLTNGWIFHAVQLRTKQM